MELMNKKTPEQFTHFVQCHIIFAASGNFNIILWLAIKYFARTRLPASNDMLENLEFISSYRSSALKTNEL